MITTSSRARQRLRLVAVFQVMVVLASIGFPVAALAAVGTVTVNSASQSPSPVTRGSTATFSLTAVNTSPVNARWFNVTGVTGVTGVTVSSSTCVRINPNSTGTISVTLGTTAATPVGSSTFTLTVADHTGNNCASSVHSQNTGTGAIVVSAPAPVATTTTITSHNPDPSNVNAAYTVNVSVTRASGSAAITGTVTVSDGSASCTDTTASGGGAATVTYSCALTSTSAGIKTLTATYGGNPSLSGSSGTATHTVNKLAQSITFPALANVRLDQAAPVPAATASSSLAVTYSTASTACSVTSGGAITLLHAGSCTIDADQAGNGIYNPATRVSRTFTVSPGNQSIDFPAITAKTLAESPVAISASASSGLAVAFSSNSPAVCSVAGSSVTLLDTGTCSITASQSGNADWNAAGDATRTFAVTMATQTITFAALGDVLFSQAAPVPAATASSGLPVTYSTISADCSVTSAGVITLVHAGSCTIDANQAGNAVYGPAAQVSRTFSIGLGQQTITFPAITDKTMAQSGFDLTATATSGLPVMLTAWKYPGDPDVCSVSGTTVTLLGPGTCYIDAEQYGNADWAPAPAITRVFDVTLATQTISFPAIGDITFGDAAPVPAATASSGLDVVYSTSSAACSVTSDGSVTVLATGTCAIDADQPGNGTYGAAPQVSRTFSIAKAEPVCAVTGWSGAYDGASHGATGTCTGVLGEDLSADLDLGQFFTDVPGGTADWAYTDTTGNYEDASGSVDIDIEQVILQVTADDATRPFGAANPPFTYTISGFAGGEDLGTSGVTGTPELSTTATATSPAAGSPYPITVAIGTLAANNYAFNLVAGSLTITTASQSITIDPVPDATYGDPAITVAATASSGLPVTLSSLTPSVCTVDGSTVTLLAAGTCTIAADQAGDSDWGPAPQATEDITVAKAEPVCAVTGWSGAYDGASHGATGTCTGVLGEDLSADLDLGQFFTDVPGGTADWAYTDTTGNYEDASGSVDIDIEQADAVCTVTGWSGVYDGKPHGATGSCTSVPDAVMGAGSRSVTDGLTAGLDLGETFTDVPGGTAYWTYSDPAGNFADAEGSVEIEIARAAQSIDFGELPDAAIDSGRIELAATTSSGLAVTYRSLTPTVCTVDATTLTMVATGSCTIEASQAGDNNHEPADPVTQSFMVLAAEGTTPETSTLARLGWAAGGSLPLPLLLGAGLTIVGALAAVGVMLMVARRRRDAEGSGR